MQISEQVLKDWLYAHDGVPAREKQADASKFKEGLKNATWEYPRIEQLERKAAQKEGDNKKMLLAKTKINGFSRKDGQPVFFYARLSVDGEKLDAI